MCPKSALEEDVIRQAALYFCIRFGENMMTFFWGVGGKSKRQASEASTVINPFARRSRFSTGVRQP